MIDSEIAAEIKESLPDDVILWVDLPNPIWFLRMEMWNSLNANPLLIVAFVCLDIYFATLINIEAFKNLLVVMVVVPSTLWITNILIINGIKAHRTVYAITDKRLVILMRSWLWFSRSVRYYGPHKIIGLKRAGNNNGYGNLEFSYDAHIHKSNRRPSFGSQYSVQYQKVGFWGIKNVETVAETIRYQYHLK